MTYWQSLVLGVVQGLTEFLPISSSGHLVVAEALIGLRTPGVVVEVALHVATLFAIVLVYWRRLWRLARGSLTGDRTAWRTIGLLALASVPAGVAGLLFAEWFERAFDSLLAVGVNFAVTGLILWSTRWVRPGAPRSEPDAVGAAAIGLAQAVAILPGVSRSGSTIGAALWWRIAPERAAEFSFLMALPAISGAALLQVRELTAGAVSVQWGPLAVGFVSALVSGVAAIELLVAMLRRGAFHRLAPYCWAIAGFTLCLALLS